MNVMLDFICMGSADLRKAKKKRINKKWIIITHMPTFASQKQTQDLCVILLYVQYRYIPTCSRMQYMYWQNYSLFILLRIYTNVEEEYLYLLHLGLVSSNRIAWNASRDCPHSEHSIPPETLRGQWPPLQQDRVAFNEPVCSLFIIFPYYSDDLSNFIYIFKYLSKLFADYRHPFVHVYTA